jgi:hypothetical protein
MKILSFLLLFTQIINTGTRRKVFTAPSCTPPTMTYRWQVANSGILCGTGIACTNGAGTFSLPSSATSNTASQGASGNQPIYTTGAINGLQAALFNGTSQTLAFSNTFGTSGTMTLYAVIEPTSSGGGILGSATAGTNGSVEWAINGGGGQFFNSLNRAAIASGAATISTSHFSTLAMTYDFTSGVANLYICSGGTCTLDGTGTSTAQFFNATNSLGTTGIFFFSGYIAEWGYLNSVNTAGIATYSQCEYGI